MLTTEAEDLHQKHLGQATLTQAALARSFDGILAELGNPAVRLVKMDVEGFESELACRGAVPAATERLRSILRNHAKLQVTDRSTSPDAAQPQPNRAHNIFQRGRFGWRRLAVQETTEHDARISGSQH
jgi:hypothetical protein